jgi:hypothetical protein
MLKMAQRRPVRLKGVLRLCSACELGGAQCVTGEPFEAISGRREDDCVYPASGCSLADPILTAVHDDCLTQRIGSYASLISSIPAALCIGRRVLPFDHGLHLLRRNLMEASRKIIILIYLSVLGTASGQIPASSGHSKLLLRLTTPLRFWLPHSGPPRKAASCLGLGGLSLLGAPGHAGRTGKRPCTSTDSPS